MPLQLSVYGGDPLVFKSGLPNDYKGPFLNGAATATAITGSAEVLVQEYAGNDYLMRLASAKIFKKVSLQGVWSRMGIYTSFAIRNGFRKEIGSVGKFHLRKDQYHCIFTQPTTCRGRFEGESEYQALDVFYSNRIIEDLYPVFPNLKELAVYDGGVALPEKKSPISSEIGDVIRQILDCRFDLGTTSFYFDLKVRELLYLLLDRAFAARPQISFTRTEAAKIQSACEILEKFIDKKPPTIRQLAKMVSLNEFKLKAGFRFYHNSGIFEWLMEKRMQHARFLLVTTDIPIKQVSSLVGYPLTTNFITAFRKRFGDTPGSYRRK